METNRVMAEKAYKAALIACRNAESVSEAAFDAANSVLTLARADLAAAELAAPSKAEIKSRDRLLYLRNRGLDD